MAIIKCKMCGGDIELSEDKTIGTCDSCGSKMTLPKIDDEQRAAAFNRGNHFRRIGEFDKALAVYERIVQENDSDAEAHWCCALCRFGIEYVEDPTTYEWLPTCHRASFDSFLEDVDYLAAVEHSDGMTRRQYRREAERIAEIQRNILATSQNEQPFDVFICYKESDENGERTRDSAIAQDIYYQLTEQGFRVFFARITLEDKVGSQYEPYIFAALNSAKVMIVVGTKPEYMNAVWVKNEWSRFLALMKRDRSKLLLPCYRDMDPYDLPEQLSVLQAYDMSKIGFIQDLIRGVSKVLGKDKKPEPVRETVVVQSEGGSNNDALLKRGELALEDGDWQKADSYFDRVLDSDAECAEAYIGKFLAEKQQVSLEKCIARKLESVQKTKPESKTAVDIEHARIEQAVSSYTVPGYLEENEIRGLYDFKRNYASTADAIRKWSTLARKQWNSEKMLVRAYQFAKGPYKETLEAERTRLYEALDALVARAEQQDEKTIEKIKADYARHLDEADQKLIELHATAEARKQETDQYEAQKAAQRQEEQYQDACRSQEYATSSDGYLRAAEKFAALGDYKDSAARAKASEEHAAMAAQKAAQKKIRLIVIIASAIVIAIAAFVVLMRFVIPSGHYKAAEAALSAGDYDAAREAFAAAGSYQNAHDRIPAVYYEQGEALLAQGDYEEARAAFALAGEYQNASVRVNETYYQQAEHLLESNDYANAIAAFEAAGDYGDAAAKIPSINYQLAESLLEQEKYEQAWAAFEAAGDYSDAATRKQAWYYQQGEISLSLERYDEAWAAFEMAGDYSDATTRKQAWYYQQGQTMFAKGQYNEAWAAFEAAGDYSDASARILETHYKQAESALSTNDIAVAAISFGKAGTYEDAWQRSLVLWNQIAQRDTIAAADYLTVAVKNDGAILKAGRIFTDDENSISDWSDIVSVSAGGYISSSHVVGLKADGTVVAVGHNEYGQCDVSDWNDIVAVSAGTKHTVGLKTDGTVVAVGYNSDGQCKVSDWSDIIAVSAGGGHTVGLRADGTVVAVGENKRGQCDVSEWTDIIAVSAGTERTVGLRSDGTVVAIGSNFFGECAVSDWRDIVAISAGIETVGLKADGTVVSTGLREGGSLSSVFDWSDIVAILAGTHHIVGLKSDGSLIATKDISHDYGQYDISSWKNIRIPQR